MNLVLSALQNFHNQFGLIGDGIAIFILYLGFRTISGRNSGELQEQELNIKRPTLPSFGGGRSNGDGMLDGQPFIVQFLVIFVLAFGVGGFGGAFLLGMLTALAPEQMNALYAMFSQ